MSICLKDWFGRPWPCDILNEDAKLGVMKPCLLLDKESQTCAAGKLLQ